MSDFGLGEKVRGTGINSGAVYEGTVVRGYSLSHNGECKIRVYKVISGEGQAIGSDANIKNVERINEMQYINNLVGPKPEPAKEPTFPTPWRNEGSAIVDANRKIVVKIQFGGYTEGSYRSELPLAYRVELAAEIVKAVNKLHAKAEDSKSPF